MTGRTYRRLAMLGLGAALAAGVIAWRLVAQAEADQPAAVDWRAEWAVEDGFALSIDTEGYQLPTSIAFVPEPGPGPKDPLYFVTELGGQIKVVTNDRSVYTFAQGFVQRDLEEELPAAEGESGLAGLCLAPAHGYVFVTFAYQDEHGTLRNNIMRFESAPRTFSLAPSGQTAFTDLFDDYETAVSHQIGSCQVAGDGLYVGVGDGRQTDQSQNIASVHGKVLRLTLDGAPAPGNPFGEAPGVSAAGPLVWAYGFRNPYSLKVIGQRLFVADNGSKLDRFVEVAPGENYLWDGTDWSIGARAELTFSPNIGPAQMDYAPADTPALPAPYRESFYIANSKPEVAGVVRLPYSLQANGAAAVPAVPEYFVLYLGDSIQFVTGVAVGPDGLYFAPILPGAEGRSAVFKVTANPAQPHPYLLTNLQEPEALMWSKGCFGCHTMGSEGGTAGPVLDPGPLTQRLTERLNSGAYEQSLVAVDQLDREPFASYSAARAEVLAATGPARLRTWTIYHLMEPRFDNPNALMPNLGLTEAEATLIADHLLRPRTLRDRATDFALRYVPEVPRPRHLFFAFGLGFAAGAGGLALPVAAFSLLRRLRRRPGPEARS